MSLDSGNMFCRKESAVFFYENCLEATALYEYKRKGKKYIAYAVCFSQEDIDEILNSKYVDQKTVKKIMGL